MKNGFHCFSEVIDFAVMREKDAFAFYSDMADIVKDTAARQMFLEFAQEERMHQATLQDLDGAKMEAIFSGISRRIADLHVSEHLAHEAPHPDMDFKNALILAMKREEKSQQLYSLLAEITDDPDLSLLFIGLANEEARHKHRLEKAYQGIFEV